MLKCSKVVTSKSREGQCREERAAGVHSERGSRVLRTGFQRLRKHVEKASLLGNAVKS